jgi:hypothetical protein
MAAQRNLIRFLIILLAQKNLRRGGAADLRGLPRGCTIIIRQVM